MSDTELSQPKAKPEEMQSDAEKAAENIADKRLPFETSVEQMVRLKQPLKKEKPQLEEFGRENAEPYLETNFSFLTKNREAKEKIAKIFENQIIIDLGAGRQSYGYELAVLFKARGYIAVDPNNAEFLRDRYQDKDMESLLNTSQIYERYDFGKDQLIPWAIIESDMLSFLESVDDGQVSVLLSGIDDFIIEDKEYRKKTRKEIERVLSPQGGILNIYSDIYSPSIIVDDEAVLDKEHYKERKTNLDSNIDIYTKGTEGNK